MEKKTTRKHGIAEKCTAETNAAFIKKKKSRSRQHSRRFTLRSHLVCLDLSLDGRLYGRGLLGLLGSGGPVLGALIRRGRLLRGDCVRAFRGLGRVRGIEKGSSKQSAESVSRAIRCTSPAVWVVYGATCHTLSGDDVLSSRMGLGRATATALAFRSAS